jgi:hypothetical protein
MRIVTLGSIAILWLINWRVWRLAVVKRIDVTTIAIAWQAVVMVQLLGVKLLLRILLVVVRLLVVRGNSSWWLRILCSVSNRIGHALRAVLWLAIVG